jgi:hypothetical protein
MLRVKADVDDSVTIATGEPRLVLLGLVVAAAGGARSGGDGKVWID